MCVADDCMQGIRKANSGRPNVTDFAERFLDDIMLKIFLNQVINKLCALENLMLQRFLAALHGANVGKRKGFIRLTHYKLLMMMNKLISGFRAPS